MHFLKYFLKHFLKPLGDGIGTAAGVAWPTFGIIFGTLGLGIGGPAAAVIGFVSALLFILVAVPITYWSYKNGLKETIETINKLEKQETEFYNNLLAYLLATAKELVFTNKIFPYDNIDTIVGKLKKAIANDPVKNNILCTVINDTLVNDAILQNIASLIKSLDEDTNAKLTEIEQYYALIKLKNDIYFLHKNSAAININPPIDSHTIRAAITGFVAAFGSIAGCAAGTLGLLISLGLFVGLMAVPVAGWIILGLAVAFGLAVATICAYSHYEKNKKHLTIERYTLINQELSHLTLLKNTRAEAKIAPPDLAKKHFPYAETSTRRSALPSLTLVSDYYKMAEHPIWNFTEKATPTPTATLNSMYIKKLN